MNILGLIPARGGSKGILNKNIKLFNGKPLIYWTIEAAKQSKFINQIIVSTDSKHIASISKKFGADVPFLRPQNISEDDTPNIEPALHALSNIQGFDWLLLLQPTSPLRSHKDIDGIIEFCRAQKALSAVSICEVTKHPYWMFKKKNNFKLKAFIKNKSTFTRRQDLPEIYNLNGALYLAETNWLKKNKSFIDDNTIGYQMPLERSVDIDSELDLKFAEYLLKKK